jgi:hypothetical protein
MKKLLSIIVVGIVFAGAASAGDQETKSDSADVGKKKAAPGAEQKALRKELIQKYDANKNGRLDKQEKSKMTPEDQAKWNSVAAAAKEKPAEREQAAGATKPEKKP